MFKNIHTHIGKHNLINKHIKSNYINVISNIMMYFEQHDLNIITN